MFWQKKIGAKRVNEGKIDANQDAGSIPATSNTFQIGSKL